MAIQIAMERDRPKPPLPPISMFDSHIPADMRAIPMPGVDATDETEGDGEQKELKNPQYSLQDDWVILKAIHSYYGNNFNGKVPWSFWQTFSRISTNGRSSSSLYHHWNGSMKKKYGHLIDAGRLEQCIVWVEQTISSGKKLRNNPFKYTGTPLGHYWSEPRTQITGPMTVTQFAEVVKMGQQRYMARQ